ncbi:MAG TPA: hypothetical protein VG675_04385 [Bryobacteraceae bacterium]|nr:hypothetical protein [Bryobacteraceae bacterium]
MTDEDRDPELDYVRTEWDAPPPSAGFHNRMLAAYTREGNAAGWWRRWLGVRVPMPVTAAAVLMAFLLAWFMAPHFRRSEPAGLARYQPIPQPRFIVVSQGENP